MEIHIGVLVVEVDGKNVLDIQALKERLKQAAGNPIKPEEFLRTLFPRITDEVIAASRKRAEEFLAKNSFFAEPPTQPEPGASPPSPPPTTEDLKNAGTFVDTDDNDDDHVVS